MPCFKCHNKSCHLAEEHISTSKLFNCPCCNSKVVLRKYGLNRLAGCSSYPSCNFTIFFQDLINKAVPTEHVCKKCKEAGRESFLVKINFK